MMKKRMIVLLMASCLLFAGCANAQKEEQEEREPCTAEHQVVHLRELSRGIVLGNLGIQGHLEVADKLRHCSLYLNSNATSCIDNRAKEYVEHHVQPLGVEYIGKIAPKTPPCK